MEYSVSSEQETKTRLTSHEFRTHRVIKVFFDCDNLLCIAWACSDTLLQEDGFSPAEIDACPDFSWRLVRFSRGLSEDRRSKHEKLC